MLATEEKPETKGNLTRLGPTRKILVAVHDKLLKRLDEIAVDESRTRSDLIREGMRKYIRDYDKLQAELKRYETTGEY